MSETFNVYDDSIISGSWSEKKNMELGEFVLGNIMSGPDASNGNCNSIVFSNGYVMVSGGGGPIISNDYINWTMMTGNYNIHALCMFQGNVIGYGNDANNRGIVVKIEINSGSLTYTPLKSLGSTYSSFWGGCGCSNDVYIVFMAYGFSNKWLNEIYYNGSEWSAKSIDYHDRRKVGIVWAFNYFIMCANSYSSEYSLVMYSSDGLNWNKCNISSAGWTDIAYGAGKVITCGGGGLGISSSMRYNGIAYSTDGINFTLVNLSYLHSPSICMAGICYTSSGFIAISDGGNGDTDYYYYSSDGISWSKKSRIKGLAYSIVSINDYAIIFGGFSMKFQAPMTASCAIPSDLNFIN